jgi:hypothetical protein
VIPQPNLYVPPELELRILAGELFRTGGVLREVANGRIFKHLPEMPPPDKIVEEAVRRAERLNLKIVVPALVLTGAALGGVIWVVKKSRKGNALVVLDAAPECVISFETSLRAYVDAGREGLLDADIVRQLVADLDAVQTFSEEGNAVSISFDQLIPLFELVIAHTPTLAKAYSVELDDLEEQNASLGGGTIVNLRRHLEAQRRILDDAA